MVIFMYTVPHALFVDCILRSSKCECWVRIEAFEALVVIEEEDKVPVARA